MPYRTTVVEVKPVAPGGLPNETPVFQMDTDHRPDPAKLVAALKPPRVRKSRSKAEGGGR